MPFPVIERAKQFVDRIQERHRLIDTNRIVSYSFVGGEPTEYEGLLDLCKHIKTHSSLVRIMSNGAASQAYWENLAPHVDSISLSHHEGRIDFDHFIEVCRILRTSHKTLSIQFAMQPESFATSEAKIGHLRELGFHPVMQALYRDHTTRKQIMPYTEAQLALLFPVVHRHDVFLEGKTPRSFGSTDELIHRRANSFTGMKCGIGTDQLCISPDGKVRGGWCRVGGILGNVHAGDFKPPKEPITCTKETCNNPSDVAVPKWID